MSTSVSTSRRRLLTKLTALTALTELMRPGKRRRASRTAAAATERGGVRWVDLPRAEPLPPTDVELARTGLHFRIR